jgi:hypothetical protein
MLRYMLRPRPLVLCLLGLLACDSAPASVAKAPPPPPFPGLPVRPAASEPAPDPAPALVEAHQAPAKQAVLPGRARADRPAPEKPSAAPSKAKAAAPVRTVEKPSTPKSAPPAPAPAPIIATTPKPEVVSKVSIPKTVHVQIDVPKGLQADLDHDPRMQPWVNQVIATIDRCYGSESKSNTKLQGTIEVLVTMHENERPDADIKQLPPALSPIVACATGGLMRTKMPLFTGNEGSRYTVRLRFSP